MPAGQVVTDFQRVYAAEHREIRGGATEAREPSTADGMTGLALSGGGIRSASFCLGVMQALNAAGVLKTFDYLSTVSGGGYIGSSMTVAMSAAARASGDGWHFPFGKTGQEVGETDETRHLRDNSRYLLQQGMWSAISAGVIYLRGIAMNVLIVLPFLLAAAALLVLFKPDTRALAGATAVLARLSSHWPFSIAALLILGVLLIVYAVGVSVSPIQRKGIRTGIARLAVAVLVVCILPVIFEIHFALLRVMFGAKAMGIAAPAAPAGHDDETHWFDAIGRIVAVMTPVVLVILPFVRQIAQKAVTAATESFADAASKWASRVILIVVAAIVPLVLWISVLQLAYWGIGVTDCIRPEQTGCAAWGGDSWTHAPALLDSSSQFVGIEFAGRRGAVLAYLVAAALLVTFWLILNVNANSLHQLYRDRLGSAFLFGRNDAGVLEGADRFMLSDIVSGASPYHLINAALNLPGSPWANRRGRNADFFIFSKCYVGSDATGYVDTKLAEKATDGLNVGTAMAISGAAAAPNMGMASMRPLSTTIALLNVRLGRWIRHPLDIVRYADAGLAERWWRGSAGPVYLLREAFFKSGTAITERRSDDDKSWAGFLFLTDGGHIENLGIYELLRRRCSLIVAVDAEADPAYASNSLIQLQRFARIDLGTRIVMDWEPIGARTKEASQEIADAKRNPAHGPHVSLGVIDYPPLAAGGDRQRGVLVYVKSSLSGDENDYILAYKARNPAFPQESTMEQLFSEEQFEAYRALGEHIGRRLCDGADPVTVPSEGRSFVLDGARASFPDLMPKS